MSLAVGEVNLSDVPITALWDSTRYELDIALCKLKLITSDEGMLRDWRGIAHFTGVYNDSLPQSKNPISDILKLWVKEKISQGEKIPSIRELQDMFGKLDRWDVYDDTADLMMRDAVDYVSRSLLPAVKDVKSAFENDCLTTDDYDRFKLGLPLQKYDAFILYADEDSDFASVMIAKLENLKLCVKDRDLLPGVGFEFKVVTKLIAERCSSLIVILSPHFLNSEENMFFLSFAQALSIEQSRRKIIPCVYSQCTLPREISYLCFLDYHRSELFGNFWKRLKDSVQASIGVPRTGRELTAGSNICKQERCTITEVKSEEISVVEPPTIAPPIKPATTATGTAQTPIVRMSDPSTHYLGNNIETASVDQWEAIKPRSDIDIQPSCTSTKDIGVRSLFRRIKTSSSKQKNKWFKKKKAVALSA